MKNLQPHPNRAAAWIALFLVQALCPGEAAGSAQDREGNRVTYEAFGAVGDGVADDLPAICKAHEHANKNGLGVRSKPDATYHLGRRALTAIIQTDTDWGTSRFIIDDSGGVEDFKRPLFEIRSRLQPIPLEIKRLTRDQKSMNLRPPRDCVVHVENRNRRLYIRRGLNRNDGSVQQEVFILRSDGAIVGGIDWNYDVVTRVVAWPIDPEPLALRGGNFTHIANRMRQEQGSGYWSRNIRISRSNTEVAGIVQRVTGETDSGSPYSGFLEAKQCANITLRDCSIDGRKTYVKIGNAGKPVAMGSYGYNANSVINFRMVNCRMEDIHDRTRWGVIGTNFMKNILLEDCVLSRMDVHQGVSGVYIIRRTTLGHAGLNAIGRGRLIIEDSTLHGRHLISFRSDYGSTWDGEVHIRNSRWIPPSGDPVMFRMDNDGTHDFGYPCSMPRRVRIDGLVVEDSGKSENPRVLTIFSDPLGPPRHDRPFPYRLTERLEVRGLETASGLPPRICDNPEVAKAIKVVDMR
jgi:hypothetical protein